jgi:GTP cyclohydrolase I
LSTLRASPFPLPAADDAAGAVTTLLRSLGEDPSRAGLRGTPERVARSLADLTAGSGRTPEEAVRGAIFPEDFEKQAAVTETSRFTGEFRDSAERRAEFLAAVRGDVTGRPELRVPDPLE